MRRSYPEYFFEEMNDKLFFVLVIFVQILFIFQGLDFADPGFAANFTAVYSVILPPSSIISCIGSPESLAAYG